MVFEMEMSKTYQYRKVMKPLLERKRRARINKCLDELKDLMVDCLTQEGEHVTRLEKADILELTVEHLRKMRSRKQQNMTESFRTGYIQAANEVSKALASTPGVDITLGTKLMTHLGHRLNQIQTAIVSPAFGVPSPSTSPTLPLNVMCGGENSSSYSTVPLSPASSGYESEIDAPRLDLLMKIAQVAESPKDSMWRPW